MRTWGPWIALACSIPTLVLAFWAGWYLRGYLHALDDTYYGLTFTYKGQKGPVVGRADELRFDWRTGQVWGRGVTLSQVGAPSVLTLSTAEALVPLPWTAGEAYVLHAKDGFAELVRYKDGTWSFQDFAPFAEAEPTEAVPVEVTATDVRIRFHDRYVKSPTTWNLAADDLVVGVLGSDASASFRGTIDGVGVVSTEFDLLEGSLQFINVSGKNLHILPLKNYFGQWEGLRGTQAFAWTAEAAEFSGKVTARPSASGDWLIRGEGEALANNLVIDGRRFEVVRFNGGFTEKGAGGRIVGAGRGLDVDGVGYLAFGETITGRIEGTASAESAAAIESLLADVLPGNLDFTGANFDGAFSLNGDAVAVSGKLTADSVRYEEYRATNVVAGIASDGKIVRILDGQGDTFGTHVRGDLAISLGEAPVIDGVVRADKVLLSQLPGIPKDLIHGGKADIQALISGPVSNPTVSLHAAGNTTVIIEFEDQSIPSDMRFDVTGDYRKGVFEVQAAEVGGDLGAFQGTGTIGIENGTLDLDLFASGIDLSVLPGTSLTGLAYGDLHVVGTTGNPRIDGFVEVYGASLDEYTLPFASSKIAYANKQLTATDIVARRGVSVIEGDATLDLRSADWPVTGNGRVLDLMLGEFTGDNLTGIANGSWQLDGSFYDPNVDVDLASPSVLADRIEIRDVAARARWANGALSIGDFSAMISGGKLTGQGGWSRTGPSSLKAHLESASTWALRPYLEGVARLGGRISGDAEVSFLDGKMLRGNAEITGTGLEINREPVGGATIIAEADSEQILFRGGLGDLDSNYVVENGVFNLDAKTVSADFYALGGNIETIMRVVSSLAENASVEQLQLMRQIDGVLTLDGRIEAAQVENKWKLTGGRADLGVSALTVQGEAAGDLSFRTNKQGDRFVIETAEWSGPQAALRLNPGENYIDENGQVSISGDIYNIDLNWFKSVRPEMANVEGKADISFVARGPIEKPEIDATIATEGLKFADLAIDLNAGPFLIRDGMISAGDPTSADPNDPGAGYLRVRDLEAKLVGIRLPFAYPATIPRDQPISALIIVPDRDLDEISEFLAIDPAISEGTLKGGRLEFSGTLDTLTTNGGISLEAPRLRFVAMDTGLLGVRATADLVGANLRFAATGTSVAGGTFESSALVSFDGMVIEEGSFLRAAGFTFSQGFGTDSRASGVVDADLSLAGDLVQPLVQGKVVASKTAMRMVGEFPAAEGGGTLPINPIFDVALELVDGQIANGLIEAQASGTGYLRGPLSVLDARMVFNVDSGELSLPNARIRLERGGVATFDYSKNFEGVQEASLNVQLNATTRVTADGGFGPQRYEISLEISGDLLSDEDLNIRASSDPPDLSQSQIMAILGQSDIIQDVTAVAFGRFEDQLKTLLSSVAAPLFLGKVSRSIEDALGLEYFSVDFTGTGIGGITIAKSLGNGFTLEYRRVLEQFALVGESLEEIKLTYRLPTSNPILGRFTVGVAATREGLLKATLSYSRRF